MTLGVIASQSDSFHVRADGGGGVGVRRATWVNGKVDVWVRGLWIGDGDEGVVRVGGACRVHANIDECM